MMWYIHAATEWFVFTTVKPVRLMEATGSNTDRENVDSTSELLRWAERVGVNRIKWNPVVFLDCASRELRERFALPEGAVERLRTVLHSDKVRCEGSLYFEDRDGSCAVSGKDCDGKSPECPFADEVWVWPDGHEDHCPNPRLRWASGR